jgi:hypothetical protein
MSDPAHPDAMIEDFRSKKELTPMTAKTGKTKRKRLSKGQRTHVRRLKQAARKAGTAYSQPTSVSRPSRVPKEEDQP